jgi:hypothetical protein
VSKYSAEAGREISEEKNVKVNLTLEQAMKVQSGIEI